METQPTVSNIVRQQEWAPSLLGWKKHWQSTAAAAAPPLHRAGVPPEVLVSPFFAPHGLLRAPPYPHAKAFASANPRTRRGSVPGQEPADAQAQVENQPSAPGSATSPARLGRVLADIWRATPVIRAADQGRFPEAGGLNLASLTGRSPSQPSAASEQLGAFGKQFDEGRWKDDQHGIEQRRHQAPAGCRSGAHRDPPWAFFWPHQCPLAASGRVGINVRAGEAVRSPRTRVRPRDSGPPG